MSDNDTSKPADVPAQVGGNPPKKSAHCHRDCASDDMIYPRASFWERYWARNKLWHTSTMVERHFRLITNEFDLITKPTDQATCRVLERAKLWEQAQAKRDCLECKIRLRYRLPMTEVFGLERMVLHLLPDDRLLSKAWSIRDAYRRLVPDDMYRKYEESKPPALLRDQKKNIEDELHKEKPNEDILLLVGKPYSEYLMRVRADAEDILNATHWWYTNSNYREARIQQMKRKLVWMLFILVLFVCGMSGLSTPSQSTMAATVVLMGMMGAIFSISRRILPVSSQDITQSDPIIRATQFDHGGTGIWLSICVGGVSAMVLYILMGTGMHQIGGELIPSQGTSNINDGSMLSLEKFFVSLMPLDTESFAKVLCWSFVAGFAEKFVPDILDRMAKSDKGGGK